MILSINRWQPRKTGLGRNDASDSKISRTARRASTWLRSTLNKTFRPPISTTVTYSTPGSCGCTILEFRSACQSRGTWWCGGRTWQSAGPAKSSPALAFSWQNLKVGRGNVKINKVVPFWFARAVFDCVLEPKLNLTSLIKVFKVQWLKTQCYYN